MFRFLRNKRIRRWLINLVIVFITMLVGVYLYQRIYKFFPSPALTTGNWHEAEVISSDNDAYTSSVFPHSRKLEKEIVILRYNRYFGYTDPGPGLVLRNSDCAFLKQIYWKPAQPTSNIFNMPCRITFSKDYLEESHALVFHLYWYDLWRESLPDGPRDKNKLWVFLQQESPLMFTLVGLRSYNDIFNWTMTYRRDSDVYYPYGYFVELPKPGEPQPMLNKTGLVAWIVSNCNTPSKRNSFVNELQKYIQVDIFGKCGQHKCPNKQCHFYLAPRYKFYLSLENALCTDYITEKFFKALKYGMVPIVYGGCGETGAADYSAVSPNHSYIDAGSFDSPKQLAEYLHYLDRNEKEYMRYFDWKTKYGIIHDPNWCNLCQRVYEHFSAAPKTTKWYKDIWKWWHFRRADNNDTNVSTDDLNSKPMCVQPPAKLTQF